MRVIRRALPALLALGAIALGLAAPADARRAPVGHQRTDVLAFADQADVGNAHLIRTNRSVTTIAHAKGVEPGVYTMWWVVWNAPENCATPYACEEPDLGNPDVQAAIGHAGGSISIGRSGTLVLAASLREGKTLTGFPTEFGLPLADGLADARHAEVHLVLRSHGERLPGLLNDQLRTFNGGCVYEAPIAGTEPAYGKPGPNPCQDLYFSVFASEDAP